MSKNLGFVLLVVFCLTNISCVHQNTVANNVKSKSAEDSFEYISNGEVKLGVDITAGGSIFYFAEAKTNRNLLNHFDKGRFMQQSYYGVVDGSEWDGKPWRWNPIQGGGYKGEAAKILEHNIKQTKLHIKSRPKHWATGQDIEDATMEQTITLNGAVAHIHYVFNYTGNITHPATHQEVPAVFADAALPNLIFYDGAKPWTGELVKSVIPGWPNQLQKSTENWAAYVDNNGWGLGVYTPGTNEMTTYRYEGDGKQGPQGSSCSYFAPIRTFNITPNMKFEYDVYMTIGTADHIRESFKAIKNK